MSNIKKSIEKLYDNVTVSLGCCKYIKSLFTDFSYSKDNEWNLHISDMNQYHSNKTSAPFTNLVYRIKTVKFKTCHAMLGCEKLKELLDDYPISLLIPIVTLLCQCPEYVITKNFICLYRSNDKAVALDFGIFKIFLVPSTSIIQNLDGFDVWTKRS